MITRENIQSHLNYANSKGYLPYYQEAAEFYGIPVEILLAKDSRETWLGSFPGLAANGWIGSDGVSKGISQINKAYFSFAEHTDPNDVRSYIAKGAEILKAELNRFGGQMNKALAAYNTGAGNVNRAVNEGKHVDAYTTGQNYSQDVINRSNIIRSVITAGQLPVQVSAAKFDGKVILAAVALGGMFKLLKKYNYV